MFDLDSSRVMSLGTILIKNEIKSLRKKSCAMFTIMKQFNCTLESIVDNLFLPRKYHFISYKGAFTKQS